MAGARCGGKRKRKGAASFTVKDRKAMLEDFQARDYDDVVTTAMERLLGDRHLDRYEDRQAFVASICSETVKPVLVQCMMEMVARYLELLKACMRGKKYAKFEQQWFEHIHEYIAEKGDQADMWRNVVCRSKLNVSEQEQRIVVSTIAYHIHDLMAEKVKKYKEDLAQEEPTTTSSCDKFTESNINLLRYGGFALHSMLAKRQRRGCGDCELDLLKTLTVTEDEWDQIPSAIRHLQQGGLDIISPRMLPFLRYVVEKTTSLVNDEKCKEQGRNMLKSAQSELKADLEIVEIFSKQIPSHISSTCKTSLCSELTLKVFHARVNEYMVATEEVQLELEGKVVKADQSLRDS